MLFRTTSFHRGLALLALASPILACGGSPPTAPAGSQTPVPLTASLSSAFDAMDIPAGAACSIAISRHGKALLERGRGQVAPGRPAAVDSLYRLGSLTKPITAAALLISEKAGRVSRHDKVSHYRAYAGTAPTIDQLIKHVPGLPPYADYASYAARTVPTTVEHLLSLIPPWDGITRYQYSNSHAAYTGAILAHVNGMAYGDVVHRDIFGPLGMSRSSLTMPPASESAGYPYPSAIHPSWAFAAGAVTSTAADMTRFMQALLNNQFGFGTVEGFDRSEGITSFGMFSYGTGEDLRFTHAGVIDSYHSYTVIFPSDRSSIVTLCNFAHTGLPAFAAGLRTMMLAAK